MECKAGLDPQCTERGGALERNKPLNLVSAAWQEVEPHRRTASDAPQQQGSRQRCRKAPGQKSRASEQWPG